jgi:hypothetical protein
MRIVEKSQHRVRLHHFELSTLAGGCMVAGIAVVLLIFFAGSGISPALANLGLWCVGLFLLVYVLVTGPEVLTLDRQAQRLHLEQQRRWLPNKLLGSWDVHEIAEIQVTEMYQSDGRGMRVAIHSLVLLLASGSPTRLMTTRHAARADIEAIAGVLNEALQQSRGHTPPPD